MSEYLGISCFTGIGRTTKIDCRNRGFVKLEDKVYKHTEPKLGAVKTQYFSGATLDIGDPKDLIRPIVGGINTYDDRPASIFYTKLAPDPKAAPLNFYLQQDKDGQYVGAWATGPDYEDRNIAVINELLELTEEKIKALRVEAFVAGHVIYADKLPPHMQSALRNFEEQKKELISRSEKLSQLKGTVPGALKLNENQKGR